MARLRENQYVTILPPDKCFTNTGVRGYYNVTGRNFTGVKGRITKIYDHKTSFRNSNYVGIELQSGENITMLECETFEFYIGILDPIYDRILYDVSKIDQEMMASTITSRLNYSKYGTRLSKEYDNDDWMNISTKEVQKKVLLTKSKFIKINQND